MIVCIINIYRVGQKSGTLFNYVTIMPYELRDEISSSYNLFA